VETTRRKALPCLSSNRQIGTTSKVVLCGCQESCADKLKKFFEY
jgi:hypothetical protein